MCVQIIISVNFVNHIVTWCAVFISVESSTNKVLNLQWHGYVLKAKGIVTLCVLTYRIVSNCGPGGHDQFLRGSHN